MLDSNPFFNPSKLRLARACKDLGGPSRWLKLLRGLNRWALTQWMSRALDNSHVVRLTT
jgi:hypothetical protein